MGRSHGAGRRCPTTTRVGSTASSAILARSGLRIWARAGTPQKCSGASSTRSTTRAHCRRPSTCSRQRSMPALAAGLSSSASASTSLTCRGKRRRSSSTSTRLRTCQCLATLIPPLACPMLLISRPPCGTRKRHWATRRSGSRAGPIGRRWLKWIAAWGSCLLSWIVSAWRTTLRLSSTATMGGLWASRTSGASSRISRTPPGCPSSCAHRGSAAALACRRAPSLSWST
mmetsp:Transcript_30084/g.79258  ORF Transcript_30084/g.79258 Transcript_30084/m.79258 type:complete len:229 (-) Transcript_30084:552-1238(-)